MNERSKKRYARRIAGKEQVEVMYDEETGVTSTLVQPYRHPFALNWRTIGWGVVILALILLAIPAVFYLGAVLRELVNNQPALAKLRPAMRFVELWLLILLGILWLISPFLHLIDLVRLTGDFCTRCYASIRDRRYRSRSGQTLQHALDEAYAEIEIPKGEHDGTPGACDSGGNLEVSDMREK